MYRHSQRRAPKDAMPWCDDCARPALVLRRAGTPKFHRTWWLLLVLLCSIGTPFAQAQFTLGPESDHRSLQRIIPRFLTRLLEFVFPWFRPNEYNIHPAEAFNRYTVCTDIRMQRCNTANVIEFTTDENPGPNGFRYQDTGPPQLQGVFWTKMSFSGTCQEVLCTSIFCKRCCSSLLSWLQVPYFPRPICCPSRKRGTEMEWPLANWKRMKMGMST